ncbi:MAG TPA: DEAD/DEAH box helicase family protein [Ignavibacteria bacterium]|nr:restriction endonuclease subunit R [Bacteroidota bacterium]HRI84057.1 DEAD/DEAH box helicase family protein [Ignavibacteria bacterium]HRK00384.1 DEAD/DEAH box helicase family protein [Ignavibacteria bacterium]
MKTNLQKIIDSVSDDSLDSVWSGFNYENFSENKSLYEFQQNALKNAAKALNLFYNEKKADKKSFFEFYKLNDFNENLDYNLKKKEDSKTAKYLLEYDKDYPVNDDNKISFEHFINRMSFWMATGSGKTLVIVKMIEMLGYLILNKEIPKKDILFLAHREDLIEQFKNHVDEFNRNNFGTKITLKSLREYSSAKRELTIFKENEITVFYIKSDLVSDKRKQNEIDYKDYDNFGNWYILLDEAHKGDKEDSKRQIYYTILSRNGFLFNFSATFTDPKDFATCVFNFNLSRFTEEGYGKHLYISEQNVKAFKDKNDFSEIEKQRIVLKTLTMLTYINLYYDKIDKIKSKISYHRPLMLTLVNSVNTEESDLEMYFKEIAKVATGKVSKKIFEEIKAEIIEEFGERKHFLFEEDTIINFDSEKLSKIEISDILKKVFNAKTHSEIEVIKIPKNNQELAFKLKSSDTPFALAKFGDISNWLKEKLSGYEINIQWDDESIFKKLNEEDSSINILMGSRSFYEGWDSNRPNIILYINIGVGTDSKKFVLQSIGRGVRVEPVKNKKVRLKKLLFEKDEKLYKELKDDIQPLESLFIYGTKSDNLKQVINTMRQEKQEEYELGRNFKINFEESKDKFLLIPVYKDSDKLLYEESKPVKFDLSKSDLEYTSDYFNSIGDKLSAIKFDILKPLVIDKVKESFTNAERNSYYSTSETNSLYNPELYLGKIFRHFNITLKGQDGFRKLGEEDIIHFKKIKVFEKSKYELIKETVETVRDYSDKNKYETEIDKKFSKTKNTEEYKRDLRELDEKFKESVEKDNLIIQFMQNHYYVPSILSDDERINYINHIINVPSEVKFVKELDKYLETNNNFFQKFDWWMFSKIDQTLDNVFIPYYNTKENKYSLFFPDFIFWLKRGNDYTILFVDPKGVEHTDAYRKIEGFKKLFEDDKSKSIKYQHEKYNIRVRLLIYPNDVANVLELYKGYCFDNVKQFESKIL